MDVVSDEMLELLVQAADHGAVRLQMTAGIPTWEAMPGVRHRRIVTDVWSSIRRTRGDGGDRGYHAVIDVMVRFRRARSGAATSRSFASFPPIEMGRWKFFPPR